MPSVRACPRVLETVQDVQDLLPEPQPARGNSRRHQGELVTGLCGGLQILRQSEDEREWVQEQ